MPGGYTGKILRVDLDRLETRDEKPDEAILRDFIGGEGLGIKYLYDEVPPHADIVRARAMRGRAVRILALSLFRRQLVVSPDRLAELERLDPAADVRESRHVKRSGSSSRRSMAQPSLTIATCSR